MRQQITLEKTADLLRKKDNIYILTHKSPDGDTLGAAYALCMTLRKLEKKVNVVIDGEIPERFRYLFEGYTNMYFEPLYIVSVDIAAPALLGESMKIYEDRIDLCIDHHLKNTINSEYAYIDPHAAAVAEIVYRISEIFGVETDTNVAKGVYYGISTDTGCFCYSNTTEDTHVIAASVMPYCDWKKINQLNFGIKSKSKIRLEQMVIGTLEYSKSGKCALVYITLDMLKEAGAEDDDLESIPSIPREIEGVLMGITVKEKEDGSFRISVRTNEDVNAAGFCSMFGGGGHIGAAGCSMQGSVEKVKKELLEKADEFVYEWCNNNQ